MAKKRTIAALIVLGGAIAACGSQTAQQANMSLYSVNQPVVQRTDFVLDLAASPDGIAVSEKQRLAAWFESLQLAYGDRVAFEESGGYASDAVRRDIGDVAGRYGLLVVEGAPMTAGQVQPGAVRVVVSRTTASVPDCPNWSNHTGGFTSTSPNFGCATNSNLAAMVADPNDLVLGQTGSGTDPATTSRAIRTYRNQQPTGAGGLPATRTSTGGQ